MTTHTPIPTDSLIPPETGFYLLQLAPGQFQAAATALREAGIRLHPHSEIMLGDESETHVSLFTAADLVIPAANEQPDDDDLQVSPDIDDDTLRAIAQWAANQQSWYEAREVDDDAFQAEFPHLVIARDGD